MGGRLRCDISLSLSVTSWARSGIWYSPNANTNCLADLRDNGSMDVYQWHNCARETDGNYHCPLSHTLCAHTGNGKWARVIASHLASSPHSPPIQTNLLLDFRGKSTNIHSIESSPLHEGKEGARRVKASNGSPLKMIVSFSYDARGGLYPNLAWSSSRTFYHITNTQCWSAWD